jgi:hypothetical protein
MAATTVGRLAIESIVPKGFLDEYPRDKPLGKKEINAILQRVAEEKPELYKDVSHKLLRLGTKSSVETGSSFSIRDLEWPVDKKSIMDKVEEEERKIFFDPKLDQKTKEQKLSVLYNKYSGIMSDLSFEKSLARGSNLARMVASGARGNKSQLNSNIGADFLFVDQNKNPVPMGIKHSYAEGLTLPEYFASGYGARAGTVDGKFAVQNSGFLSKQLASATMDTVVTEEDCSTKNGIPVEINDDDTIGSVLAKDFGSYKAGTIVTNKVLKDLRGDKKIDELVVRSPITCEASRGGVCAHCTGIREYNRLPKIGENVGLPASQAMAEPLTQALLSSKHSLVFDTQVLMADMTSKEICNIKVGDWVMGCNNLGEASPAKVVDVIYHGKEPVSRYFYRLGSTKSYVSVDCTEEHLILANRKVSALIYKKHPEDDFYSPESRKLVVMKAGDKRKNIGIPMPVSCDKPGVDEPMAMLYGALLGDGIRWAKKFASNAPRISCADPEFAKDMNEYLAPFDLEMVKCKRGHDWRLCSTTKNILPSRSDVTGRFCGIINSPLKKKLIEWGLQDKYCWEKDIPMEFISKWSKKSLAELLVGYIATDGSISIAGGQLYHIEFGSTSKPLVEKIKFIIEKVFCCYGSEISSTDSGRKKTLWQYSVNRIDQVKKLLQQLPEIPGIKKYRAKEALSVDYGRFAEDFFYRCPRTKIEFLGYEPCFDLTVDNEDNLFVLANGIITHNSAGVANAKKVTGFKAINAMFQVPDIFPNKATLAKEDGIVEKIEELSQGGYNAYINGIPHYISPENPAIVKPGDSVEAGDTLTSGLVNPAEVAELKGIGQGRLAFLKNVKDIFAENGINANRRNIEVIAKSAIDHVKINDPDETSEYLPDDIVRYGSFVRSYQPRETSYEADVMQAQGKFLERPVLHYSIGTKITPSVANRLKKFGENKVFVNDEKPAFESRMIRLMDAPSYNEDWMAQFGSSYIQKNLKKNVLSGDASSDIHGLHPLPALAFGKEFGKPPHGTVGY